MRSVASVLLLGLLASGLSGAQNQQIRTLDDLQDIGAWKAVASDSVSASLRQVEGSSGKALCLDYDFNGVSGYAVARRTLPMMYPDNYEYTLALRGSGPPNNLEFKLGDASGDNVWWVHKPNYTLPRQWTPFKLKKRQIEFAWGPTDDKVLRASNTFEITISAGKGGGKGEACIDQLAFRELPVHDTPAPRPVASASSQVQGSNASASKAVDDDATTAWRAPRGEQALTLDLGREREFGGVTLHWLPGLQASRYRIALSDDGQGWREVREVVAGNGGDDPVALPESESRYLRLELLDGPGQEYALADFRIEPLDFAATPNDFLKAVAAVSPRGYFPRAFVGEQPYWTILGIDGGREHGLIGEDGAIEPYKGGFSIEPFLRIDGGALLDWSDVQATQSLQDGYLPIPSVEWRHRDAGLRITAFAQGGPDDARLVARYRLTNTGTITRDYTLALLVRPFQVNPPSQFLNTVGGFSAIRDLSMAQGQVVVDGTVRVRAVQPPDASFASTFDAGMAVEHVAGNDLPDATRVHDDTGLASGAWLYRMRLAPGESREVAWDAPLSAGGALRTDGVDPASSQADVAEQWHRVLDRVGFAVPAQGKRIVDTLRTALANMLISRNGPRLQPGTRSYARAWIRDGAMISEGLLRLGREDVAADFLRWYAPYQFDTGKVPCCVDDRGSDPVPENDSQGELIYAVAELYRYTGDRALLESMWPHVAGAVRYMDALRRSERTPANRKRNPAFFGLMPASISHEGYSAKPMHSYWDDFWALRGYKDAVAIAQWLGRDADARRFAASRDQFSGDLYASIAAATTQKGIDFIPGSAELGDFDATSTTIALAPGGESARLPGALLSNTFERYWNEFRERRDGVRDWDAYTPYELRTIGTFVRLGWRDRIPEVLDFFMGDQQPPGWNQWAEVVSRTPRKPFFLGDLPHAWVASDYVRSVLDMFAYERERDASLVIAAGIPSAWLAGEGIAVDGLRTPFGSLAYRLRESNGHLSLQLAVGASPPGGFVLPWPYRSKPGATRINGKPAEWRDGELHIAAAPALVEIALPH